MVLMDVDGCCASVSLFHIESNFLQLRLNWSNYFFFFCNSKIPPPFDFVTFILLHQHVLRTFFFLRHCHHCDLFFWTGGSQKEERGETQQAQGRKAAPVQTPT